MYLYDFQNLFVLPYEGEVEGEVEGDGGNTPPKDFTPEQQAIFNKAQADLKRGFQSQINDLQTKLQTANLNAEQKTKVEEELETLRGTLRTKEEQAIHDKQKLSQQHTKQLTAVQEEAKQWQTRYSNMHIQNSLLAAAGDNNAFNPQQIVQILQPNTSLVEGVDGEGKPNGTFSAVVKLSLPDDKGNMAEMTLPPSEAVSKMAEAKNLYGEYAKVVRS